MKAGDLIKFKLRKPTSGPVVWTWRFAHRADLPPAQIDHVDLNIAHVLEVGPTSEPGFESREDWQEVTVALPGPDGFLVLTRDCHMEFMNECWEVIG